MVCLLFKVYRAPLLALLQANEDLIAGNRTQLDRLLDLYLGGKFNQDALIDRKTRLEETIAKLEAERAKLSARLSGEFSQADITELIQFAHDLAAGLDKADKSFETRQRIIELLDVRGILVVEDGERVCRASFVLTKGVEKRLVIPSGKGAVDSMQSTSTF